MSKHGFNEFDDKPVLKLFWVTCCEFEEGRWLE
jgi:hypothetical protein